MKDCRRGEALIEIKCGPRLNLNSVERGIGLTEDRKGMSTGMMKTGEVRQSMTIVGMVGGAVLYILRE